jgi:hypothetical protein
MDMMIEFFKTHLNWAAVAGLIGLGWLYYFSMKNTKMVLITSALLLGYLGFIYHKMNNDPQFVDRWNAKVKSLDIEKAVWGEEGGATTKAYKKAQERNK